MSADIDYRALLDSLQGKKDGLSAVLEAKELKKLCQGSGLGERLRGIFTRDRYRRVRLLKEGFVVWGRVFNQHFGSLSDLDRPYPAHVLFSPAAALGAEPEILDRVVASLNEAVASKQPKSRDAYALDLLTGYEDEPQYVLLPPKFTASPYPIYLSTVFIDPEQTGDPWKLPPFIPLVIKRRLSKEALPLPVEMYSEEYLAFLESR